MSLVPRPELLPEGIRFPAPWSKLIAYVALILRLSLGLGLLNDGLAAALTQNGPGGPGFGGRPINPFTGAVTMGMPGMEGLIKVLPFAELAVGVGLILGIFTTICALAACALTLVTPAMTALSLMVSSGIGPGSNRGGSGLEFLLLGFSQSTLSYAVLVLLSPVAINRLSMDALIFRRATGPIFPMPIDPTGTPSAPTELTEVDLIDPA